MLARKAAAPVVTRTLARSLTSASVASAFLRGRRSPQSLRSAVPNTVPSLTSPLCSSFSSTRGASRGSVPAVHTKKGALEAAISEELKEVSAGRSANLDDRIASSGFALHYSSKSNAFQLSKTAGSTKVSVIFQPEFEQNNEEQPNEEEMNEEDAQSDKNNELKFVVRLGRDGMDKAVEVEGAIFAKDSNLVFDVLRLGSAEFNIDKQFEVNEDAPAPEWMDLEACGDGFFTALSDYLDELGVNSTLAELAIEIVENHEQQSATKCLQAVQQLIK